MVRWNAPPVDWITSIKATGSPVVANLSTFDADFAAERIDLNVKEGLIEASGSKGVQLKGRARHCKAC